VPDLSFSVTGVESPPQSAIPLLHFKLSVRNADPAELIQAIMLRCQIRIEPGARPYSDKEKGKLLDLFGEPARWAQTLRSMLWTHCNIVVPPFQSSIEVDLPAECTFDLTVASAKYFDGLEAGEAPLLMLFSGTVFYQAPDGTMQIAQIPWSKEAAFRLPVGAWKEMMDAHYPNAAWLCLRRDVFERLHRYKVERGIPTWEQTLESILP
jgi:hypothetical protein